MCFFPGLSAIACHGCCIWPLPSRGFAFSGSPWVRLDFDVLLTAIEPNFQRKKLRHPLYGLHQNQVQFALVVNKALITVIHVVAAITSLYVIRWSNLNFAIDMLLLLCLIRFLWLVPLTAAAPKPFFCRQPTAFQFHLLRVGILE